ncbi:hypothetical protein [Acidisphaera sp. L21]|uniref:hypothetical protein n=1 Tax=Acidisphaera sp. L21 TaxID=1641851 RepID=UPI00131A8C70|nr:hypothetical protein [Acidisphaera sp. L21]
MQVIERLLFCIRSNVIANWRGFGAWLQASKNEISLIVIPLHDDPLTAVRKTRKGLRDVRDRAAANNLKWRDVAFAGIASEKAIMVIIRHQGIPREALWWKLEGRWPGAE